MSTDPLSPAELENPVDLVDEIAENLDKVHRNLVDETARMGHARDAIRSTRPVWEALSNSTFNSDDVTVYASGVGVLAALRDGARQLAEEGAQQLTPFHWIADAAMGTVSTASTTGSFSTVVFTRLDPPPRRPPDLNRFNQYADRFERFDAALGNTYRAIGQVLYGTQADPERAALYLMRQAFDHLFDRLSPDEDVRRWLCRKGVNPELITREHRIKYAAGQHITEKARANTLSAYTKHTLDVYQRLNSAHKRGELDSNKARTALQEMQEVLEQWADALEIQQRG